MRGRSLAVFAIAACLLLSQVPLSVRAGVHDSAPAAVAKVRWILHGVTVRPPKGKSGKGKTNQKLYSKYGVSTGKNQRTSLSFPDATELHLNQRTSIVLRNPHLTRVTKGEIDQVVSPGTKHQIQTASAVASAIGTEFDVRVAKKTITVKSSKGGKKVKKKVIVTTVTVREGVVNVHSAKGDVAVHAGQQTTVVQGQAPGAPKQANADAATSWTRVIPQPDVLPGKNVALQDNGGRIVGVSSQDHKPSAAHQAAGTFDATNINDGSLTTSWSSAAGENKNQWVKLMFQKGDGFPLDAVVIDPAATGGHPAANDVKDFEIWVSATGSQDSDFHKIFAGQTAQGNSLQRFKFPTREIARYVKFVAVDNYGGTQIDVAEFEAVSSGSPTALATLTPTPAPTLTPTPTLTATPGPTNTPAPTATPIPTATPLFYVFPTDTPDVRPTKTPTPLPTDTPTPVPTPTPCIYIRQC